MHFNRSVFCSGWASIRLNKKEKESMFRLLSLEFIKLFIYLLIISFLVFVVPFVSTRSK